METPWTLVHRVPAAVPPAPAAVTLFAEIDVARTERRGDDSGRRPTVEDRFLHATGRALREHPSLLAVPAPGGPADAARRAGRPVRVGLGSLDPARGCELVIEDADEKTLDEIAAETRAHADRAWRGAAAPSGTSRADFAVVHLGVWGVERFTGTLGPGQRAALTVGEARLKPVCRADGRVTSRRRASIGLTLDPRLVDPIDGACFLETLQLRLDDPEAAPAEGRLTAAVTA